MCGKSSSASSWISLLGNSSIDQVSELMTCDGDIGEKAKVRTGRFYFRSSFSPFSFSTFIHLIYTCLLSSYYVSDAVIKSWGRVKHENMSSMGLSPGGERCAPVDQKG